MAPLLLLKGLFDLPKIAAFFVSNWKEIAVISMIALIFYQNTFEHRYVFFVDTIPYWQQQAETNKEALDTAINANKTLTDTINARNLEISKWKEVSDRLAADNRKLQGTLDNMRQQTNLNVQKILEDPAPKSCSEALDYLRQGIGDLQWSEQ